MQSAFGFEWKGLFVQWGKNDTINEDKNVCNAVGPQTPYW